VVHVSATATEAAWNLLRGRSMVHVQQAGRSTITRAGARRWRARKCRCCSRRARRCGR
jgi:hypothetical protein